MGLTRELGKRFLGLILVLFLVTLFTALLISMVPGDPVDTLLPVSDSSPEVAAQKEELRAELEPGRVRCPSATRPGSTTSCTATSATTTAPRAPTPCADHLAEALPVSIQLMIYAQLFAVGVRDPLGIWHRPTGPQQDRQSRQRHRLRPHRRPELRPRPRARLLRRRGAEVAAADRLPVRSATDPGRALPPHGAPHHQPRVLGQVAHLHAAPSQRHDRPPSRRTSS